MSAPGGISVWANNANSLMISSWWSRINALRDMVDSAVPEHWRRSANQGGQTTLAVEAGRCKPRSSGVGPTTVEDDFSTLLRPGIGFLFEGDHFPLSGCSKPV